MVICSALLIIRSIKGKVVYKVRNSYVLILVSLILHKYFEYALC